MQTTQDSAGYFKVDNIDIAAALGLTSGISYLRKFGRATALPTGVEVPVWSQNTVYPWQDAAQEMWIASTSADDAVGGTGAQQASVVIQGDDGVETLITVSLDGTTKVSLGDVRDVYRIKALDPGAGAAKTNVGDLYVGFGTFTAGEPATIMAHCEAGEGQTLMAIYRIPAGKYGLLRAMEIKGDQAAMQGWLRVQDEGGCWSNVVVDHMYQTLMSSKFVGGELFAPGTRIMLTALGAVGPDKIATGYFEMLLADESEFVT